MEYFYFMLPREEDDNFLYYSSEDLIMSHVYVDYPVATEEELAALDKASDIKAQTKNANFFKELEEHNPGMEIPPVDSLTPQQQAAIDKYNKKMQLFKSTHHYIVEEVPEDQQVSFILRHRGGVVFPWIRGGTSAQETEQARQKLSEIKAGTYRKGVDRDGHVESGGELYSFESFIRDVIQELEVKPEEGWVRKS